MKRILLIVLLLEIVFLVGCSEDTKPTVSNTIHLETETVESALQEPAMEIKHYPNVRAEFHTDGKYPYIDYSEDLTETDTTADYYFHDEELQDTVQDKMGHLNLSVEEDIRQYSFEVRNILREKGYVSLDFEPRKIEYFANNVIRIYYEVNCGHEKASAENFWSVRDDCGVVVLVGALDGHIIHVFVRVE